MEKIINKFEKIYKWNFWILGVPMIVIVIIEVINVIGRKLSHPVPCAVEAVEAFLVLCIYLGVSAVAYEGGHVNVVMATRRLSESVQAFLDGIANLMAMCIFGIWAWASWIEAFKSVSILEMRIGVFRFPIYPFKIIFAIGLVMLTLQLLFNAIKFMAAAMGHPMTGLKEAERKALLEL